MPATKNRAICQQSPGLPPGASWWGVTTSPTASRRQVDRAAGAEGLIGGQHDPQAVDRVIGHMMSMECTPQSTIGRNLAVTTGDAGVSSCHFGDLSRTGAVAVFGAIMFTAGSRSTTIELST